MTMAWSQHVEHHLAARALDEHGQLLRRAAHHELARRGTHLHTGPHLAEVAMLNQMADFTMNVSMPNVGFRPK